MNMQQHDKQRGFTLIELMIVIAIIGILAAVALPLYQDYVARSQISEGVAQAGALKVSISEFTMSQGKCPADSVYNNSIGGRYTKTANHKGCAIEIAMRSASPVSKKIQGAKFAFAPANSAGTVLAGIAAGTAIGSIANWACYGSGETVTGVTANLAKKYLPSGCRPN